MIKYPDLCFVKINSQTKVNQMKKLKLSLITACMVLLFIPTQLKAENNTNTAPVAAVTNVDAKSNAVTESEAMEIAASNAQLARLEEIKTMDMSTMSRSEKKELRDEVKSIDQDQQRWNRKHDRDDRGDYDGPRNRHNGQIYFIGGGGLLILLLLLLLL